MKIRNAGNDPATIALRALVWICNDLQRADRFLAITGIEADDLRARLMDPALHQAVMAFLANHEADLLACAEALDLPPSALVDVASEAYP